MTASELPAPSPFLVDGLGRRARDLRVSLSQACTLRCRYCMPAHGLPSLPTPELLTAEEVCRLVDVAVERLGIAEVRLTGGEPLVRRDLERIIAMIRARHSELPLALTTNGVGLAHRAADLVAAGLSAEQALAMVNRLADQQAYTMAVTDVFYLSSVLFFVLVGIVWLARPKMGAAAGGGGAH